jgi:hypothetical protein
MATSASRSLTAASVTAAFMLVFVSLAGCAAPGTGRSPVSPSIGSIRSGQEAEPVPHLRTIGAREEGGTVVLRVGDRLNVVPESRFGGWTVVEVPTAILRLDGSPGAAARHVFIAMAVGDGQLTLSAAGPEAHSIGRYSVRIRVVRDTVQ